MKYTSSFVRGDALFEKNKWGKKNWLKQTVGEIQRQNRLLLLLILTLSSAQVELLYRTGKKDMLQASHSGMLSPQAQNFFIPQTEKLCATHWKKG